MKKAILSFLAVSMALTMAACGGGSTSTAPSTSAAPSQSTAAPSEQQQEIDFPKKPIQIIAPAAPGGDSDFNTRAIALALTDAFGENCVAVNVAGNSGITASTQLLDTEADGYTAMMGHNGIVLNKVSGLVDYSYDAFEMIGGMSKRPGDLICVNKNSGWNTLDDFINAAKENPGKLNVAISSGSMSYYQTMMLQAAGDVTFNNVEGGDAADRVTALLSGQIDMTVFTYGAAKPYLESGDFVALAVLNDERNPKFGDIPTAKEQGYDVVFETYYSLVLPKGTPEEVVTKWRETFKKAVETNQEYAKSLDEAYAQVPEYVAPDDMLAIYNKLEKDMEPYK